MSDGPDAGAALVVDDRLVARSEQEHHARVPHASGLPWEAVEAVVARAGLTLEQVDLVAVAGRFTPPFFLRRHPRLRGLAADPFSPAHDLRAGWQAVLRGTGLGSIEADRAAEWLDGALRARGLGHHRVLMVDIHRALAAAAYRSQPDDAALVLTMQPGGDGAAVAVHRGRAGQLDRLRVRTPMPALHTFAARSASVVGLPPSADQEALWVLAARGAPDPELVRAVRVALHRPVPTRTGRRAAPWRQLAQADPANAAASIYAALRDVVVQMVSQHLSAHPSETVAVGGETLDNPRIVADLAASTSVGRVATSPLRGWAALPLGAALSVGGVPPRALSGPQQHTGPDPEWGRAALPPGRARPVDAERMAELLHAGRAVGRLSGPPGFSRQGGGTSSVLVRADDVTAVADAREALGRPDLSEPALLALPGVVSLHDADALAGPFRVGAAAPRVAVGHTAVRGALTADGRVGLQWVDAVTDPGLYAVVSGLARRGGPGAVAVWPLALGQAPTVERPTDAVAVLRAGALAGLQVGAWWVEA